MSRFLFKSLLYGRISRTVKNPFANSNPLSLRWLSSSSSSSVRVSPNEHSFTVSYLINSLGFSLEASKAIAKRFSFKTRTKPDKAIDFLRNFGFTQTQIPRLVRAFPQVLAMNTERTILPKLEFLESKGISRPELTKSLSAYPTLLGSSLDNQIIPTFESLRTLLPSEAKIAVAVQRYPDILVVDVEKYILPNVSTLRSHGVPDSNIAKLIFFWSRVLMQSPVRFRASVEEVSKMGFSPSKVSFLIAVYARVYKSKWESKVGNYKKLGWSENDISRAFLKYPWCMTTSEDRVTVAMDFFVSEMGLKPTELADCPIILNFSLKKRVIPRVRVFRALVSKGLLKKNCTISSVVTPIEKVFLQRFVTPFVNVAPELMKMYEDEKKIGSFKSETLES